MFAASQPVPVQPLAILLAELRAHLQHRAAASGPLALLVAVLLAALARVLAEGEQHPALWCHAEIPAASTMSGPHAPHASGEFAHRATPGLRRLARLLFVVGPAPRTGMRALPGRARAPRAIPRIRPPPAPIAFNAWAQCAELRHECYDIIIKIPRRCAITPTAITPLP